MNIERLTEIAEWLEAGAPERNGVAAFNMVDFNITPDEFKVITGKKPPVSCGSICCIAGTANVWWPDENNTYMTSARKKLGLSFSQANTLFFANEGEEEEERVLSDISPAWAARCVRKLIATGCVDWNGTKP
jgi:hypothetical protein